MKIFIACVVMLVAIVGCWWYTMNHMRESALLLQRYQQDIEALQIQQQRTEEALAKVEALRNEVAEARRENQSRLMESLGLYGDDRFDYLERLLNEDACRRAAGLPDAATGFDGAMY